jgi:hypothetical protein
MNHLADNAQSASSRSTRLSPPTFLFAHQSVQLTQICVRCDDHDHKKFHIFPYMCLIIFRLPPQMHMKYHKVESKTEFTITDLPANERCVPLQ